jgi:hypothetical protein
MDSQLKNESDGDLRPRYQGGAFRLVELDPNIAQFATISISAAVG